MLSAGNIRFFRDATECFAPKCRTSASPSFRDQSAPTVDRTVEIQKSAKFQFFMHEFLGLDRGSMLSKYFDLMCEVKKKSWVS